MLLKVLPKLNNFSLKVCHPFYIFLFVFNFHEAIILSSWYFFSRQFDPIIFCSSLPFQLPKSYQQFHILRLVPKNLKPPHCCGTSLCVQSKSLEFSSRVCLPLKTRPAQHNIPPFIFFNFQLSILNLETIQAQHNIGEGQHLLLE